VERRGHRVVWLRETRVEDYANLSSKGLGRVQVLRVRDEAWGHISIMYACRTQTLLMQMSLWEYTTLFQLCSNCFSPATPQPPPSAYSDNCKCSCCTLRIALATQVAKQDVVWFFVSLYCFPGSLLCCLTCSLYLCFSLHCSPSLNRGCTITCLLCY
jgi:hypothetical protein